MAVIRPFQAVRPASGKAEAVAALPYDVYNRKEACEAVKDRPLSFLQIDRAETSFPDTVDTYDPLVYKKADEMLKTWQENGTFVQEEVPCFYVYALTMDGRTQTGLAACSSIDDYLSGVILKHENTRADKELDRIHHVDTTSAQTGPIFLAYRDDARIDAVIESVKQGAPLYDFVSEDGIGHALWRIDDPDTVGTLTELFGALPHTYIADGHHRAASAVKVGLKRREAHPDYDGTEEFNYFLSVLFPQNQLKILDYNRVVKDLGPYTPEGFTERISADFDIEKKSSEGKPYRPEKKGEFGMLLNGSWYKLTAKPHILSDDPVKGLDVSILQDHLFGPVLGIEDPKTDSRIDFIGGIPGLAELEKRVHEDSAAAFAMFPTSMEELFRVADAGLLMPPKSTWFEPKLRSGLLIHRFER